MDAAELALQICQNSKRAWIHTCEQRLSYFVKVECILALTIFFFRIIKRGRSSDSYNRQTTDLHPTLLIRAVPRKCHFSSPPGFNIWGWDNLWIQIPNVHLQCLPSLPYVFPNPSPSPLLSAISSLLSPHSHLSSPRPVRMISGLLHLAWLSVVRLKTVITKSLNSSSALPPTYHPQAKPLSPHWHPGDRKQPV